MAVSHLRSGAGTVQTNVEALEHKVSEEVVGMKTAINEEAKKVREELSNTVGRFAAAEAAITAITGELYNTKILVKQLEEAAASANANIDGGNGRFWEDKKERNIMEHKSMQFLKPLGGDKGVFRQWHQKFVTALFAIYEDFGNIVKTIETASDTGTKPDEMVGTLEEKYGDVERYSKKLYTVLMDKAEGEAFERIRMVGDHQGILAYAKMYRWFTEISGLGLSEQTRRVMHPDPPKREEDLADAVEAWAEKMRRLEGHGPKYALPAMFKQAALKLLMVGKSKDHFDIWQAGLQEDDEEGFKTLLNQVRDYARKQKLEGNVKKAERTGGDVDIGEAGWGNSNLG